MPEKQVVRIRGLTLGEGLPKLCVPLTGRTEEELFRQAKQMAELPVDLVEWRVDLFEGVHDWERIGRLLPEIRHLLGKLPLLFTCRTAKEGGGAEFSFEEYISWNRNAAKSGAVDLVDVEIFFGREPGIDGAVGIRAEELPVDGFAGKRAEELPVDCPAGKLTEELHAMGVPVIASNHDFTKTPGKSELLRRLCEMQRLNADILKLAVMPQGAEDVLKLLCATDEMVRLYADRPVVTMSMGAQGVISRVSGEFFGSALTFGSAGTVSAPGQLPVNQLREVIQILHDCRE